MKDLNKGHTFEIFITTVTKHGSFYVVKKANEDLLVKIANHLQMLRKENKGTALKITRLGWSHLNLDQHLPDLLNLTEFCIN